MPDDTSATLSHGHPASPVNPGTQEISLLDLRPAAPYQPQDLAALAHAMANAPDDPSDGPDPEENLAMPAGYTYLGQFIDHDLTLDTSSTLDLSSSPPPNNVRSPRFDLDCIYGNGPDDQPYMYFQGSTPLRFDACLGQDVAGDIVTLFPGASLLPGNIGSDGRPIDPAATRVFDLLRSPNGRAIIGDKRNDENSIVNQIQQLFIAFHNRVVESLAASDSSLAAASQSGALFKAARNQVRWCYQRILTDDFLPRIVDPSVLQGFVASYRAEQPSISNSAFRLYPASKRLGIPREFSAAAYRFGHSAVRLGYRLNAQLLPIPIFPIPNSQPALNTVDQSLLGFEPLDSTHVIDDWGRFFPADDDDDDPSATPPANFGPEFGPSDTDPTRKRVRLQYAYKLDPSLVQPLTQLPGPVATLDVVQPPAIRTAPPSAPGEPAPSGPNLALLNLLRGNVYRIGSGQDFERALGLTGSAALDTEKYLKVRTAHEDQAGGGKLYSFTHIRDLPNWQGGAPLGDIFTSNTPLWFYILAEAQKSVVDRWLISNTRDAAGARVLTEDDLKNTDTQTDGPTTHQSAQMNLSQGRPLNAAVTRLGPVGGRIVAEVFYGLLDSDDESVFNLGGDRRDAPFRPVWGDGRATMAKLIRFTRQRGKDFSKTTPPTSW